MLVSIDSMFEDLEYLEFIVLKGFEVHMVHRVQSLMFEVFGVHMIQYSKVSKFGIQRSKIQCPKLGL